MSQDTVVNFATSSEVFSGIPLTEEQHNKILQRVNEFDFLTIQLSDISTLGSEAETALHKTLDVFLSKIDQNESPQLFSLFEKLKDQVDSQQLPDLADRILNSKPGLLTRIIGVFSPKYLSKAVDNAFDETKRIASGKTKTLVDYINQMESELNKEKRNLQAEIVNMEQLKNAYQERFSDFVFTVSFGLMSLEKAKASMKAYESTFNADNPIAALEFHNLKDKLQSLESRVLALQSVLLRLPTDQIVIRQLQNAGITTLQEVITTASSRFASIKSTLLTLHSALAIKSVQKLANQGKLLDDQLAAVRNNLIKDVVVTAQNAPGNNRLDQANQLKQLVSQSNELITLINQARLDNQQKFAQARQIFSEVQQELLVLGKNVRPDTSL